MAERLEDLDSDVRRLAEEALSHLGEHAASGAPKMTELLGHVWECGWQNAKLGLDRHLEPRPSAKLGPVAGVGLV